MDEKDPRLIVTLEAYGTTAERAWNRPQNRDRCLPASEFVADISSRESTPAVGQPGSQIQLTFDDKPKNLEKGFVFGSDPRICDVFLGERGAGFSGQQFCITFNERGEVIFKNKSRKEAQVNYNGENPSPRNQFTWILFDTYKNIKITMGEEDDLIFKVKWPENRKYCPAEYEAHRDAYFEERRNAFPPLSQLDMETQQPTAMPTAQHSPRQKSPGQESPRQKSPGQKSPRQKPPGQEPIYLLEEELGYGGFGTVYKAVDVSTGDVHAAKKFHHGDWKKEVDILTELSHEHIVKFVNYSEEQQPLLVMEYLPLGNLACQGFITEEETLQILCQGLQALEYLHSRSPPLAHRDIKPANILVRSRMPFVIKLVDFGLAKNDSSLKTFCGSNEYAAPEIWGRHHYTAMVDIWSLGVVVLQFGYGLPTPTRKPKGSQWCRDIVKAATDGEDGDTLIDLLSTKMLRMDYRHRGSASDCLGEVYRLRFHEIQTVDIGRTTPTGKTAGRDGVTRSNSVIAQPLQHARSDSGVSSGFYDIGGASEMTEVAPSKRDRREGTHFYNRPSPPSVDQHPQGPTHIWNPQSRDISKSTLSKRRRQQTVQSASDDARERGQSKRSRASVSFEAGEDPSEPQNSRNNEQGSEQNKRSVSTTRKGHNPVAQPRQIPQLDPSKAPLATDVASLTQAVEPVPRVPRITRQVTRKSTQKRTRSPLGRTSPPAAEVSPGEVETPSSKRNIHDNVRALLAGNVDGENEGKAKVTDFGAGRVQMKFGNKAVMMRKEDGFLNATQIIALANKTNSERKYILGLIKQKTKVEVLPATAGIPYSHSWINFQHGRILCKHLGLDEKLQPLIDCGAKFQCEDDGETAEPIYDYLTEKVCQFIQVPVLPQPVSVRRSDLRINATHVLRAAGRDRKQIDKIRKEHSTAFDIVLNSINSNHQGTYVDFSIGIRLCQQYGLAELEERLLGLQPASEEARPTHVGSLSGVLESLPKSLSFPELAQTQMPSSNNSVAEAVAEVTGFDSKHVQMIVEDQTMLLRKEDCFLNATQIIKLAKKDRNERKMILEKMKKHTKVDVRRIDVKSAICGSWVNLQHGRTLCKHLGLERQLQPLLEYAQRLQGDDVETDRPQDPDYLVEKGVHPLFVAVRALPEPVMIRRLDWRVNSSQVLGVAGRNESDMVQIRTEYKGAYDSVQHEGFKYNGTYVDFDVAMDLCRRYGLVGLESQIRQVRFEEQLLPKTIPERTNSDVQPGDAASQTGVSPRADSASPQEWRESQHTELMSSPDSSDPEDNQIQVNNLGEEYPVLDAASESSIGSREASTARASDPSSIRLRATTAPFHQHTQYSFRQTDPPPPPAPISYYNSWDYQPPCSGLSEVNLDLKPQSWETASPYKSFTDIC